jgi:hypothetical protein
MLYTYILLAIDQPHLKDTNSVDNVAELLMKGGFIMIPIILLSIFSIYLFIERYLYIRKSAVVDENLIYNIIGEIRNKRPEEALVHTRNNNTSLGRILESGQSDRKDS